jgi:hypothetical protein
MGIDGLVELAILGIRNDNGFKRYKFCRIRCEVSDVLLHGLSMVMAILYIVGSAVSRTYNPPRTSEGKFKLAHTTFRGNRPNGTGSKDNVIRAVDSGIALM